MSTYLVAFVICDYESISNKTKKGIEVAIHTPPGLLPQATFALQSAVQVMDYYDEFFGVEYPLPKQGTWVVSFLSATNFIISRGMCHFFLPELI